LPLGAGPGTVATELNAIISTHTRWSKLYNLAIGQDKQRCGEVFVQDGFLIVRTRTIKGRHQTIVNIENTFDVVEKETHPESHLVVIVSRQPTSRGEPAKTGDRS
jgi:hypothetical protein